MIKVGIIGGTGYTGVELLRAAGAASAGGVARHHLARRGRPEGGGPFPNLRGHIGLAFTEPDEKALGGCDVVFSATPNGVAMYHARALLKGQTRLIDLAADFRLQRRRHVGEVVRHAARLPELLAEAVYGLPRSEPRKDQKARLIANPGCYPTAVQLGFLPLVEAGLVDLRAPHRRCQVRRSRRRAQGGSAYAVRRGRGQLQGLWPCRAIGI